MNTTLLLSGIRQRKASTARLEIAYLEAGTGSAPVVLIHGNCSSSLLFQDCMLALAVRGRYPVYAPDMRGYGDSEMLPVDAKWGVRDFSDDLSAFARALGLSLFHWLGWSLGGNGAMQYAIDYAGTLRTLTLEAPGNYPGDMTPSPNWPAVAPGTQRVNNALPSEYLNQAAFATAAHKPPSCGYAAQTTRLSLTRRCWT